MRRPRLIIMLKEPQAGKVKTRLGRGIGMTAAAWWFRHQTSSLIRNLSPDRRWEVILAVSPQTAFASRFWPARLRRLQQGQGDLGIRMKRILENAPDGPAIIIGGDIPGITTGIIADAFKSLGQNELVFGPATDGGFWLVGAKRTGVALPQNLFKNIRWSSKHTLADTLNGLKNSRIGFIARLQDVDTTDDLQRLKNSAP